MKKLIICTLLSISYQLCGANAASDSWPMFSFFRSKPQQQKVSEQGTDAQLPVPTVYDVIVSLPDGSKQSFIAGYAELAALIKEYGDQVEYSEHDQ